MAIVESLRPDPAALPTVPPSPAAEAAGPGALPAGRAGGGGDAAAVSQGGLRLDAFRTGRADDRLVELLAYALAVEAREAAARGETAGAAPPGGGADQVERLREQAARELHDHAFRFLHNRVEEIRAEAVAERVGNARRPPGFVKLVLANLAALAIAAAGAAWLQGHPEILGPVLSRLAGG